MDMNRSFYSLLDLHLVRYSFRSTIVTQKNGCVKCVNSCVSSVTDPLIEHLPILHWWQVNFRPTCTVTTRRKSEEEIHTTFPWIYMVWRIFKDLCVTLLDTLYLVQVTEKEEESTKRRGCLNEITFFKHGQCNLVSRGFGFMVIKKMVITLHSRTFNLNNNVAISC